MNERIDRFMLRALVQMSGEPMPEAALFDAVRIGVAPRPTDSQLHTRARALEALGLISGERGEPPFENSTTWTLTEKGKHRAAGL